MPVHILSRSVLRELFWQTALLLFSLLLTALVTGFHFWEFQDWVIPSSGGRHLTISLRPVEILQVLFLLLSLAVTGIRILAQKFTISFSCAVFLFIAGMNMVSSAFIFGTVRNSLQNVNGGGWLVVPPGSAQEAAAAGIQPWNGDGLPWLLGWHSFLILLICFVAIRMVKMSVPSTR